MHHFHLEYILLYLHRISVFTQNLGQTHFPKKNISKALTNICSIMHNNWILNPFLYVLMQHNEDYVIAAVFGGYFYIINRMFSIR